MKEDYSGEKFLSRLFKDLYLSSEVQNRSKKSDKTYEAIKKYMDKLEKVHSLANTENKKDFLKEYYFRKYVIKEENIPTGIDKEDIERIISNQKKSLSLWIDYLTDENARYPMWAKYWAFQGMLKLGTYDDVHGVYQKRSEKTIAPFVEANPAIIANCINNMISYINSKQTLNEEVKPLLETGSFKKLYEYYKKKFDKEQKSYGKNDDGKWIKYNEGSREDAHKLYLSLQNKGVEWCTANENMAIDQVCGARQYVGGDFYVYYTLDENNEYTVPRIAIRMDGQNHIGEIRGRAENQNLEEEMIDVLETKLHEMSFVSKEDIDKNMKIVNELRELYEIYRKTKTKEEISEEEIISLYTKKYGFGWQNDPKVADTIKNRKPAYDIKRITDAHDRALIISKNKKNKEWFEGYKTNDKTELLELIDTLYYYNPMKYAGDILRNEKEVIMYAIKHNHSALEYASDELKNDKEIVLEAVKQNGLELEYASDKLRDDKDVAFLAVKGWGSAIMFAGDNCKNDRDVVMEAFKQAGKYVFEYFGEKIRRERKFVLELMNKMDDESFMLYFLRFNLLDSDEIVMLEAAKRDKKILTYANFLNSRSEKLLRNKSFLKNVFDNCSVKDIESFIESEHYLPEIVLSTAKECINERKKLGNIIKRKFKKLIPRINKSKNNEEDINEMQEENIDDSLKL